VLEETFRFYQEQWEQFPEARQYLAKRGIHSAEVLARLRVGYAPGGCLRAHLERLGYARAHLQRAGLIDDRGRDRFWHCVTFPLETDGNLYGRAIAEGRGLRHQFLPRPKGGLYGWKQAWQCSSLIVVEGLLSGVGQPAFHDAAASVPFLLSGGNAARTLSSAAAVVVPLAVGLWARPEDGIRRPPSARAAPRGCAPGPRTSSAFLEQLSHGATSPWWV
jgi:hypothetical protein